jgi:hypothetical protein
MKATIKRLNEYFGALKPVHALILESAATMLLALIMLGIFGMFLFRESHGWLAVFAFAGSLSLLEGALYFAVYYKSFVRGEAKLRLF